MLSRKKRLGLQEKQLLTRTHYPKLPYPVTFVIQWCSGFQFLQATTHTRRPTPSLPRRPADLGRPQLFSSWGTGPLPHLLSPSGAPGLGVEGFAVTIPPTPTRKTPAELLKLEMKCPSCLYPEPHLCLLRVN